MMGTSNRILTIQAKNRITRTGIRQVVTIMTAVASTKRFRTFLNCSMTPATEPDRSPRMALASSMTEVFSPSAPSSCPMRFSVTVVVGDGEGHVGMGLGKAIEIPEAVRKATEDAKKKLIYVPTVGTTVPHETVGEFGAGKVLIMPSAKGTGVIAGSSVRTVLEAAGIKDVRAKSLGTSNTGNMARATMEGLKNLTTVEEVAKRRGKTPEEIIG